MTPSELEALEAKRPHGPVMEALIAEVRRGWADKARLDSRRIALCGCEYEDVDLREAIDRAAAYCVRHRHRHDRPTATGASPVHRGGVGSTQLAPTETESRGGVLGAEGADDAR